MTAFKKLFGTGLTWLWVALIVIILDRYTKLWVVDHLVFQGPLRILPFFDLTLAYNTGAAFSFLHSASGWQNWFLGGLALMVSMVVLCWLGKLTVRSYWMNIALCLVLGGALGNAWDRARYGHVIDFLSFHLGSWHFAIFNMADSAICVGAFMIFCYWFRHEDNGK
jgi:signal peptidase II